MAIHQNLINTGSLRETRDGIEEVIDLAATEISGNASDLRYRALRANGVPRVGDAHPIIPGARVVEVEVLPVADSPSKWRVVVRYSSRATDDDELDRTQPFGPTKWSIFARTQGEETQFDFAGRRMQVHYEGRPKYESLDYTTGEPIIQTTTGTVTAIRVHRANVERPILVLQADRWERDDPERAALRFHGRTNDSVWRGYPKFSVLLQEVRSEPDPDGGYRVSYGFVFNPKTWRAEATITVFTVVPLDATEGNGIEFYHVYEPVSFAPLSL